MPPLCYDGNGMDEIVFQIEPANDGKGLIASWDDPQGGGITTQAGDLGDLQEQIAEAVRCHFDDAEIPRIRLHFTCDPVLTPP